MLLSSLLPLLVLPLLPHALQVKHTPLDSSLRTRQDEPTVDSTDTDSTDDMGNEDQTGESYYTNNPDDTTTYSLPGDETGSDTSSSGDDTASPTDDSGSYYATESAIQALYTDQIASANAAISSDDIMPTFAAGSAVATSADFAAASASNFFSSEAAPTTAPGSAAASTPAAGATSNSNVRVFLFHSSRFPSPLPCSTDFRIMLLI